MTPRVSFSDIDNDFELLGDLNITSYGLDAYRKISDALQASGGLSYVERGYEGAKSTRDGNTMGISAGINYLLSPRTNISFSANYQRVDADTDAGSLLVNEYINVIDTRVDRNVNTPALRVN